MSTYGSNIAWHSRYIEKKLYYKGKMKDLRDASECSSMPGFFSWLAATFIAGTPSSPQLLWVFTFELSKPTLAKKCGKNAVIKMKLIAYLQVWSPSLGRPHAIFLILQNKQGRLSLFGDCDLNGGVVGRDGGTVEGAAPTIAPDSLLRCRD